MAEIIFEINNGIAFVTLNRPEKLNAFNRPMALLLQEKLIACKDAAVRCVYLTGTGKGFCAGQDLEEIPDPTGPGMNRILKEQFNPIIIQLQQLQKPVVAAVNGVAAGAGANIALACDIVVAHEQATFIQAFSKIGLIPDSGGTYFLPRLIGYQKAMALMMLGDKVSATEACTMGMIYKIFQAEEFETASKQLANTLAAMPTQALAYIKQALQTSADQTLEKQLALEDELQQKAAATHDFKEGVAAFMQKRAPHFKGH
ncbi:enoyl-CoA hydratase-related protein [Hydrotalea sp.]|uniref:enoyl-CoA hydratase-related protein n=1 Tax=Hydrotalea sp. TaxID=2881279 RepID=UPI00263022E2|nr:enoyl-CoA hydratase-related protein [Hydrotalea sp.]